MKIVLTKPTPRSTVKVRAITINMGEGTFLDHDCGKKEFQICKSELAARLRSLESQGWERKRNG